MIELLSASTLTSEIRLARQVHKGSILIVEGISDDKLFKRLVSVDCLIRVGQTKITVTAVVATLQSEGFRGVLGIVDADFTVLDRCSPEEANLLVTDTHDLETMMLKSEAFDAVIIEYGATEKLRAIDPRAVLLMAGTKIGKLRWLSQIRKMNLRFDGMRFNRFVETATLELDVRALVCHVLDLSSMGRGTSADVEQAIAGIGRDADPWQICCGHDLTELLSIGLRRKFGSQKETSVSPEALERALRLAFSLRSFSKTMLYGKIRLWETENPGFSIISVHSEP